MPKSTKMTHSGSEVQLIDHSTRCSYNPVSLGSLEQPTPVAETRVERRLATILAADVVGYSRLMGQDEAGTLAILKA
jgi:class 3 adenylate cyclase